MTFYVFSGTFYSYRNQSMKMRQHDHGSWSSLCKEVVWDTYSMSLFSQLAIIINNICPALITNRCAYVISTYIIWYKLLFSTHLTRSFTRYRKFMVRNGYDMKVLYYNGWLWHHCHCRRWIKMYVIAY